MYTLIYLKGVVQSLKKKLRQSHKPNFKIFESHQRVDSCFHKYKAIEPNLKSTLSIFKLTQYSTNSDLSRIQNVNSSHKINQLKKWDLKTFFPNQDANKFPFQN